MSSMDNGLNTNEILKPIPSSFTEGKSKDLINTSNQEFNKSNSYIEVNITTYPLKITFVGDSGVGKSSIIKRFCENKFEEKKMLTTISAINIHKKIKIDPYTELDLEIWDTAGQERFRSMCQGYLRDSNGVFLVFDLGDKTTFESLESWLEEIKSSTVKKNCVIMLIGNKCDFVDKKVDNTMIDEFVKNNNMKYLNVSAKDGINIESMFEMIGNECVKAIQEQRSDSGNSNNEEEKNIIINNNDDNEKEKENDIPVKKHKTKKKKNQRCC